MRTFEYLGARTLDEAVAALQRPRTYLLAGGTDLLGVLKDAILPEYPDTVVDLKTIAGLDFIEDSASRLRVGALTRLADIARHPVVCGGYAALAQAAGMVASPQIREMGTIAGNICQLPRCWYFRVADDRFACLRKDGRGCPAATGEGRYHSIFGRLGGCAGVSHSDLAPALVAFDADVVTTKRVLGAEYFFQVSGPKSTVLDDDEVVVEVRLPALIEGGRSAFTKYALRKAIDFPIVNCAVVLDGRNVRICLNAVYNTPYRAVEAERLVAGRHIDEALAEEAGAAAVAAAQPLESNRYKVEIAKAMVKRALLACR